MNEHRPTFPGIGFAMAGPDDLDNVHRLLADNGLPSEDIAQHMDHLLVAWDDKVLVGTVAVELLGENGLLRSLCVAPAYRQRGLAAELCDRIEAHAKHAGVRRLCLLTTTARAFFARRGYRVCARDDVPVEVTRTTQFRLLCPVTATCMMRELEQEAADPA